MGQLQESCANPDIFKKYDVRGEWEKEWDRHLVYRIGLALVVRFKPRTVAIGRDMRASSPIIFEQLSRALIESGVDVIDLGQCATEITYFASWYVPGIDLALMITASHNPGKDNGIKVCAKEAVPIGLDNGLSDVRDLVFGDLRAPPSGRGTLRTLDVHDAYRRHVISLAGVLPEDLDSLKIVVDPGNGMGGHLFDRVLSELEAIKINWQPDGTFPSHEADPFVEENVEQLKRRVLYEGADVGVAYDGDSDRIFFVDERGQYVPGYYLAAILTEDMLERNPLEQVIVHDPRYYWATQDVVRRHGALPIKCRVGHTLIKQAMREHNCIFSAECSGHVFYRSNKFAESTMLTTLLVLQLIKRKRLGERVQEYRDKYPISGEMNYTIRDVSAVMERLKKKYNDAVVDTTDGMSIEYEDWRFNIRCSNTQPLVRLNIEAKHIRVLKERQVEMAKIIES